MPKDVMTYQCNKSQQVQASNNDAGSSSKGTWDEELSVGSAHKRLIETNGEHSISVCSINPF